MAANHEPRTASSVTPTDHSAAPESSLDLQRLHRAGVGPPRRPKAQGPFVPAVVSPVVSIVAGLVAAFGSHCERPVAAAAVIAFVAWSWNRQLLRVSQHMQFLPLLQRLLPLISAGGVLAGLGLARLVGLTDGLDAWLAAIVAGVAGTVVILSNGSFRRTRRIGRTEQLRVAVIGSEIVTLDLRDELLAMERSDVCVVGNIATGARAPESHEPLTLGRLGGLAEVIAKHRIDLLLLSDEAPRMAAFDEVAETCSTSGVRMQELHAFYEHTFGHVPLGRINAAWFQWVMHPRYKVGVPASKRAMDLVIASVVSVFAVPLIGVLALLIRRDGGPALYRQSRVGEYGEPFEIFKLRSMRVAEVPSSTVWTTDDDERVTRIGRFLRRTHLDELPQLVNVFRGEMSIVGPRPEQPGYVSQLEQTVPHYSRRNIARPGITGWAQVKCGYAGSDQGSTWKLSHDLYYLKHRSTSLDLLILGETLRTLVADRQFDSDFRLPSFVGRREAERLNGLEGEVAALELATAPSDG